MKELEVIDERMIKRIFGFEIGELGGGEATVKYLQRKRICVLWCQRIELRPVDRSHRKKAHLRVKIV